MNNIFSYYTKYRKHVPEYTEWNNKRKNQSDKYQTNAICSDTKLRQKAHAIAEPLLLLDNYEHEKAEDAETFFQTYNIELMSIAGVICSLPVAAAKSIPFFEKHAPKNQMAKNTANLLKRYKNAKIGSLPLQKILTAGAFLLSAACYAKGIKDSMQAQLGLIRMASFNASQNLIDNPKLFTIPDDNQQNQICSELDSNKNNNIKASDKIKDKININSSFVSVKDYTKNHNNYEKSKKEYFNTMQSASGNLTEAQIKNAKDNQQLFENLLLNVEHDVLEPLRKVETVSNIAYSSLFMGGFLEYLLSDKIVDVLHIKNKPVRAAVKIGVPLLSYMLLNKNISDIENKAILATKYKYLKRFTDNPDKPDLNQSENNEPLPKFLKTVLKDMKEYDKFAEKELPNIKKKMKVKKSLNYSDEQMQEAKELQKGTSLCVNTQREKLYDQSVGIKSISETILGPLDIVSTAIGALIGKNLSKKFPNNKFSGLFTAAGAVIAFIPAAIAEAVLTKQQKLAEKTAVMLAIKDLKDYKKYAVPENKTNTNNHASEIFSDFI
ncbi:MAG: hypothetical protein LUG16_02800 [Candidatus Gastranaerophilales bacterium]|nr:hypothetical protein [Candidatus Gastranaerophilales bacterium]